jgi:hypothetical protein
MRVLFMYTMMHHDDAAAEQRQMNRLFVQTLRQAQYMAYIVPWTQCQFISNPEHVELSRGPARGDNLCACVCLVRLDEEE